MSNETTVQVKQHNPKPMKKCWVVVFANRNVAPWSISYLKRDSIRKFLEGTSRAWSDCFSDGTRCIKVDISFQEIE